MPGIKLREGDSIERALKVLKRQVEKSGHLKDLREHLAYSKPSEKKKRKSAMARRRLAKAKRKEIG